MRCLSLRLVLPYAIIHEHIFSFSLPGKGGMLDTYQYLLESFSYQATDVPPRCCSQLLVVPWVGVS